MNHHDYLIALGKESDKRKNKLIEETHSRMMKECSFTPKIQNQSTNSKARLTTDLSFKHTSSY